MTEDLIRQYINDELAKDVLREPLRDDDLLLEHQILDSLGLFELVGYLESEFDIEVRDEELVPGQLRERAGHRTPCARETVVNKTKLRNEIETSEARGPSRRCSSVEMPPPCSRAFTSREGNRVKESSSVRRSTRITQSSIAPEVRLGAALAAEGFAVIRFHYRGQGHSDGDTGDVTFESLRDDALAATEYLQSEADVPGVSFIGSRVGALVAGAVSAGYADSRLVLWEPIVDPSRYLREAQRSMSIARMSGSGPDSMADDPAGSAWRWLGRHTWIPHLQTSHVESGREDADPR